MWKITKYWGEKFDKNNKLIMGWKYEVALWINGHIIDDGEVFDKLSEAKYYQKHQIIGV